VERCRTIQRASAEPASTGPDTYALDVDQISPSDYTALLQLVGSSSRGYRGRVWGMVKSLKECGAEVNYL